MSILYRAEVIGSLLRPPFLKEAREQLQAGTLSTPEFKRLEDRAVDEALALQESAGVDVVTDGEMRRTHFIAPLTDVISGVKEIPAFKRLWRRPHAQGAPAEQTEIQVQYAVVEKIRRTRSLTNEEFTYARGRARKPLKVTLPSPADDDAALVARTFARRLSGPLRPVRRRRRDRARRGSGTGGARLPIHPDRRPRTRDAVRPGAPAPGLRRSRDGPRTSADRGYRHHQLGRRGSRRHLRSPSVPRQQPGLLRRRGRLRGDRASGLQAGRQFRALAPGVRRLAIGICSSR